jgi:phosphonoacetaldehyde hydrolase
MALANVLQLGARAVAECVKVDDTAPGIEEGRRAGMWAVGVALSGNEVGYSEAEWAALDSMTRAARHEAAVGRLRAAGAHYVVDTVAELPWVVADIERRMRAGELP